MNHEWPPVHRESAEVGKSQGVHVRFEASEGPGSHGTLHVGGRKTTVKDRKKEIGKGLFSKMLADLGIDEDEL